MLAWHGPLKLWVWAPGRARKASDPDPRLREPRAGVVPTAAGPRPRAHGALWSTPPGLPSDQVPSPPPPFTAFVTILGRPPAAGAWRGVS